MVSPLRYNAGFDPTADILHSGIWFRCSACAVSIAGAQSNCGGGAARPGSIGDPSAKRQDGSLLASEALSANIAKVKEQLKMLLDFETKANPARLLTTPHGPHPSAIRVLRDIGNIFGQSMIAKRVFARGWKIGKWG